MRRTGRLLVLLSPLLLAIHPAASLAGGPFLESPGCQQLSVEPPRYRLEFSIANTHGYVPLCGVSIEPESAYGAAAQSVLACTAPELFTASLDSTHGTGRFDADSCFSSWGVVQHFRLEVSAIPATFRANLLTTGGAVRHSDLLYFPCATLVPVVKRSWGSVKLWYR